jgi:hypothetical protein
MGRREKMCVQPDIAAVQDAAKAQGHIIMSAEEAGLIDIITCACGWKSRAYHDNRQAIQREYVEHLVQEGILEAQPFFKPVTAFQQAMETASADAVNVGDAGKKWSARQV